MARPLIRRSLRIARVALVTGAVASFAACATDAIDGVNETTSFAVGTGLHTITVGTLDRTYILHVPSRRPMSQSGTLMPYPLMIVLHGSSGSGDDIRATTNMDSVSEANRVIVAYPNGVAGSGGLFPTDWNAGTCCGEAARENIDDIGFMRALIAEVSAKLPVDQNRIHVAGFSDGGRMAYYMACQMADRIAAIGVVSGSLVDDGCEPARSVPVIAMHGTDDPIVPFDAGVDAPMPAVADSSMSSLPPSIQFWIAADGCAAPADSAYTTSVTRTTFGSCSGADVAFYTIDGGVHTWPVLVSPGSSDPDATLSATTLIAQFFKKHSLK
jgi:polyhydroxybutyrate depolymerase